MASTSPATEPLRLTRFNVTGWVRWPSRKFADNSHIASQSLRLIPGSDMTTSVINVVQSLLEAAKNAADKRKDALECFNNIETTFDDIEYVFQIFPHDPRIREASVDLVAVILEAVEAVIKFYEKGIPRKMLTAYFKGDQYESNLTECLENIKERSEHLANRKVDADIIMSRREAQTQSKVSRENLELTRTMGLQTSIIEATLHEVRGHQVTTAADQVAMTNTMQRFLDDATRLLHEKLRAATPAAVQYVVAVHMNDTATEWVTPPSTVWNMLGIPEEIEKADMRSIEVRQESLPSADRGRAEQIVNLQRFQDWLVFDTANLHRMVNLAGVQRGELAGLCQLFGWLVRQLPRGMTLICIFDDLGYYERESFFFETSVIMNYIVQLMQDQSIAVLIKVFATSTISVRKTRQFFPEGSVLDLSTVSDSDGSSRQRLRRQLDEGFNS
ncbi:hypothetical protein N0V86_007881 [Didymella sp. IMI 355093]|nr:hypothetical protein N0V86_007881 [Didymella sp. IMI 355093]